MSPRAALLIGKLSHAQKEWEACSKIASKLYEYPEGGSREDFISKCKSGEFKDLFALYRSNDSNPITGDFNEELVNALPDSLKYICHNGAGYNNIDVAACSKRGISVSSTPIAVDDATADVAIWLMLGALRNIKQSYMAVNAGLSELAQPHPKPLQLTTPRQMARHLRPRPRSQRQNPRHPRHGRHWIRRCPPRPRIRHENPIPQPHATTPSQGKRRNIRVLRGTAQVLRRSEFEPRPESIDETHHWQRAIRADEGRRGHCEYSQRTADR